MKATAETGEKKIFTSIGGQAVIEGVMMRSPHFVAIAVRKPNGRIAVRHSPFSSISSRIALLRKPVFRGVSTLIESMVNGVEALSFSATIAADEENTGEELSGWAIAGSITTAVILGMGLFVALPHFLTAVLGSIGTLHITPDDAAFHVIDGAIKIAILLAYVYLIAMMKDIRRVFQYHGAEHKSIFTFEAGEELTVENARKHSTLHPRCGTSFLLFLVLISIAVFSVVFPLFGLSRLSDRKWVNHGLMIAVKMALMLPVSGLAYEFIKACSCRMDHFLFRAIVWPGLMLQKLTTREPTDQQLEVALASLRQVLRMEKGADASGNSDFEVGSLSELTLVPASAAEFPEL